MRLQRSAFQGWLLDVLCMFHLNKRALAVHVEGESVRNCLVSHYWLLRFRVDLCCRTWGLGILQLCRYKQYVNSLKGSY